MNDPLDNAKTMKTDMNHDTIGDMLTQQPDQTVVLADRYRVVRKLGEGGMGSVWLAGDTRLDGRKVAIKMLPVVLVANKRAIQQLKAEAKVAIQLSHTNIATLRTFEESDQGPFLVMDYIPGQTLEDLLADRGSLQEDEIVRLFRPIAQALDYAHGQKVIHRDIKPSNILIRSDGVPFLTDFGIAREMKDTMTRVTGRSTSGTLPYMSPEQIRGDAPTTSQDVYSLAATLYECVAGHPPFHRGQIEHQILSETPPPLDVGLMFCKCMLAGLSKDPASRPTTCSQLIGGKHEDVETAREDRAATGTNRRYFRINLTLHLARIENPSDQDIETLATEFFRDAAEHSEDEWWLLLEKDDSTLLQVGMAAPGAPLGIDLTDSGIEQALLSPTTPEALTRLLQSFAGKWAEELP